MTARNAQIVERLVRGSRLRVSELADQMRVEIRSVDRIVRELSAAGHYFAIERKQSNISFITYCGHFPGRDLNCVIDRAVIRARYNPLKTVYALPMGIPD